MPAWQSGFIQTNGIRLHYARTGSDQPPVVLAHGFSDDGLCWTPVARALEMDYDVVMVDARYHGRSDAPKQDCDSSVMAEDLAGAITGLRLPSPIILGHSMGAVTILLLAARYPELPGAIALEDPPARWAPAESRDSSDWLAHNRAWIAGLKRQSPAAIIAAQHAEKPDWSAAELAPWADSKLRFRPSYFDHVGAPALDWRALLPRINCPVLLVTGDPERGSIVTAPQAAELKGLVPQLCVAHIPGAGHNIRRE